jgi:4-carboxymuconolactone decarboxylase
MMHFSLIVAATIMASTLAPPAFAEADQKTSKASRKAMTTATDLQAVAPALEKYLNGTLGELWKRKELSPRDRSVVTMAILIARNQPAELREHLDLALQNGVKPKEISEIITHLAFYSGWGNAMSAVSVAKVVFAERKIGADQLPEASPKPLPLDEAAEAKRAENVGNSAGPISPGLVKYTGELLFKDLWLRPDLAPRDRSLVTVSSLIASGQFAQITFHLGKAMDNGLTKEEASEVITQAAFYAGWPNAFSAVPVFKTVFEGRAK